jgi:nucleotide-binding universal stress UspA family protein
MFDKILVPLDGSELAEVTLWYAEGLAGRMRSAITLLIVISPEDLTSRYMYDCYLKEIANRTKVNAEERGPGKKDGEIKVDYEILKGDAAEEIIDYAHKAKINLIIMSTQGRSGVRRWPLGNVADKVLRATRKPVLLIRAKGAKPDVYRESLVKVLVPVDGSRESESILRYVTYMATELNLEVTLFHVLVLDSDFIPFSPEALRRSPEALKQLNQARKNKEGYIKRLETRLKGKGVNVNSVFKEVLTGGAAEEIIKLAEEGDFSMVAMSTHGRSGVGRWIFGSNAEKVLEEGSTPVLLVRPAKRREKTAKAD